MKQKDGVGSGPSSQRDQVQTIDMQGTDVLASDDLNTPGHQTDMTEAKHVLTAKGLQDEVIEQAKHV